MENIVENELKIVKDVKRPVYSLHFQFIWYQYRQKSEVPML